MTGIIIPAMGAQAQNQPHIGYAVPDGGQQGTAFEVKVGGQYLERVEQARITGEGISVKVLSYIEPEWKLRKKRELILKESLSQAQSNNPVSDKAVGPGDKDKMPGQGNTKKMDDPNPKAKPTPEPDEKPVMDVRMKKIGGKRQKNVQIDDTIVLQVTIAPDAAIGNREIRLLSPAGFSNPLLFQVGDLPEISEASGTYTKNTHIPSLPVLLNGQMLPGEVKEFSFSAKKGQRLVFAVQARALIPYLADAVPGWFQAVLSLFDSKGKKLAFLDDYQFSPDPVLVYDVLKDDDYKLEIRDSIYRGRQDFVYRLSVGELPFLQSIFPLGGYASSTTRVEVAGVNLPSQKIDVVAGQGDLETKWVSLQKDKHASNRLPFAVDTLPQLLEKEPNNDIQQAQAVRLPVIVNGRIDPPRDVDVFRFDGKKGDRIVVDVTARRMNSPLDSRITLTDQAGTVLQMNDDHDDRASGLITHQADSFLAQELPSNGVYFVFIGDTQGKGGESYSYRMRLSPPQPDFALRVVPSMLSLPLNGMTQATVYAVRKDGFQGKINLSLDHAPKGCSLNPSSIPEDADNVHLTLLAGKMTELGVYFPVISGSARIQDKPISHVAVPADDMMQAFAYRHLVPAQETVMYVTKGGPVLLTLNIPKGRSLSIPVGGSVKVTVTSDSKKPFNGEIKLALDDPPKGIWIEDLTPPAGSRTAQVVFHAEDEEVKAGTKGTLILHGVMNQRIVCTTPAYAFEATANETDKRAK